MAYIVTGILFDLLRSTAPYTSIKGKRACPPEDVGGVWGYAEFLQALNDPEHPEHTAYTEWIGGDFDPEAFDRDAVNERLKGL